MPNEKNAGGCAKDYPLADAAVYAGCGKDGRLEQQNYVRLITGLTATVAGCDAIYLSWSGVPGRWGITSTDPQIRKWTFIKITMPLLQRIYIAIQP